MVLAAHCVEACGGKHYGCNPSFACRALGSCCPHPGNRAYAAAGMVHASPHLQKDVVTCVVCRLGLTGRVRRGSQQEPAEMSQGVAVGRGEPHRNQLGSGRNQSKGGPVLARAEFPLASPH